MAARRQVHLPPKNLEKCSVCESKGKHCCSKCIERRYCSKECQKADWKAHKLSCRETVAIDLDIFYPCLAALVEMAHLSQIKPVHPALRHQIVNSPNPGAAPYPFPDGDAANLVLLGEPLDPNPNPIQTMDKWWPTGASDKLRRKLYRRIMRENYVLPNLTAIAFALLSTIYTTGSDRRSTRLRSGTKLIVDFGIIKGSARVTNQDKLAYLMFDDDEQEEMVFEKGQDPNDHYWLYFTTVSGDDVLLDCAMFTFNMCILVGSLPYLPQFPGSDYVPAVYINKELTQTTPGRLHTERQRFSFLRNSKIHAAATHPTFEEEQLMSVATYMREIAGGTMETLWLKMLYEFIQQNLQNLNHVMVTELWKTYPTTVSIAIEYDPGECTETPDDDMMDMMKKWKRKVKKGKMTQEEVGEAFNRWKAKLP